MKTIFQQNSDYYEMSTIK